MKKEIDGVSYDLKEQALRKKVIEQLIYHCADCVGKQLKMCSTLSVDALIWRKKSTDDMIEYPQNTLGTIQGVWSGIDRGTSAYHCR